MIAVIADDFTGAAELGGIGLRYGLQVEIATGVQARLSRGDSPSPGSAPSPGSDPLSMSGKAADLLIISADTRSMSEEEAGVEMERLTRALLPLNPVFLYKKVDSVLRGHVAAEMDAHMRVLGLERALLVPANPKLERTIRDGRYFLKGKPIHESSFADDPEFAIRSSEVRDMVRRAEAHVLRTADALPASGIVVGEVTSTADLAAWAERLDEAAAAPASNPGVTGPAFAEGTPAFAGVPAFAKGTPAFAAGASGFFTAILDKLHAQNLGSRQPPLYSALTSAHPGLIVCGSTFEQSRDTIQKIHRKGGPVSYMPSHLAALEPDAEADYERWAEEVVALIRNTGRAIVAVNPRSSVEGPRAARMLRERTARLVQKVLGRTAIRELFIEGGSTAYAILQQTGLHTFFPMEEMAAGVIRMRVGENPGLSVTVKPGSYTWPASAGI